MEQVWVPGQPVEVVQEPVAPRTQVKPSSATVSQSSSAPLQVSTKGVQEPQAQEELQVREPVVPQEVVQVPVVLRQQAKLSSQAVSQSSSAPLQVSAGGVQEPQAQEELQVREPVVPQEVVQVPVVLRQQA